MHYSLFTIEDKSQFSQNFTLRNKKSIFIVMTKLSPLTDQWNHTHTEIYTYIQDKKITTVVLTYVSICIYMYVHVYTYRGIMELKKDLKITQTKQWDWIHRVGKENSIWQKTINHAGGFYAWISYSKRKMKSQYSKLYTLQNK